MQAMRSGRSVDKYDRGNGLRVSGRLAAAVRAAAAERSADRRTFAPRAPVYVKTFIASMQNRGAMPHCEHLIKRMNTGL